MGYDLAGCWMHEKNSFALIQLVENGIQSFVPHVDAVGIREDAEAGSSERIERVVDLRQTIGHRRQRKGCEEPKAIGHKCDVWADDADNEGCKSEQKLRAQVIAAGGRYEKFDKSDLCGQRPMKRTGRTGPKQ